MNYSNPYIVKYPSTFIHEDARIHESVDIDPFVTVEEDVVIGEGTWIGSNVVIHSGARIGRNCHIFPGAIISAVPQDLKFNGESTLAEIGDNTTIRQYATVNRGTSYSGKTVVGKNVLIMSYAFIAHDCVIRDNSIIANTVNLGGHVDVGEFAIIGAMSGIHQFVNIGKHAILSGGAMVAKDVPPFCKAGRYPLSFLGVNTLGMKRRGFDAQKMADVQEMYRMIYQQGNNTSQALKMIEEKFKPSRERDDILKFVRGSQRGIMKGFRSIYDRKV